MKKLIGRMSGKNYDALVDAIENRNEKAVQECLDYKVSPNAIGEGKRWTPLIVAIRNSHRIFRGQPSGITICEMLLNAGADVEMPDRDGNRPMGYAVGSANPAIVKLLLDRKANVNSTNKFNTTHLMAAATSYVESRSGGYVSSAPGDKESRKQVIFMLLDAGADRGIKNANGKTAMEIANECKNKEFLDVLSEWKPLHERMKSEDADIAASKIFNAALKDDITVIQGMHNQGYKFTKLKHPNQSDYDVRFNKKYKYFNALMVATNSNAIGVVKFLMSLTEDYYNDISCNTDDIGAKYPLMIAASKNYTDLVKYFIEKNININQTNQNKQTALHFAAVSFAKDSVDLLLAAGANTALLDNEGQTPLHQAVLNYKGDVVLTFIYRKAKLDVRNSHGQTALHIAAIKGRDNIVVSLVEGGASINAIDAEGYTPVMLAMKNRQNDVAGLLLRQNGVDLYVKSQEHKTVFDYARELDLIAVDTPLFKCLYTNPPKEINFQHATGFTFLTIGARWGFEVMVEDAIDNGAEIDLPTNDGKTALIYAAIYGHKSIVEFLLKNGADIEYTDSDKKTALDYARDKNLTEIIRMIGTAERQRVSEAKQAAQRLSATNPQPAPTPGSHVAVPKSSMGEIAPADLVQTRKLGEGAYGIVFAGIWLGSTQVAIKQLKLAEMSDKVKQEFESETQVMANLRHPNIVQYYGVSLIVPYKIVMEYCDQGSLYAVLQSDRTLSWDLRNQWSTEIARGVVFLHSHSPTIIHRDLKSLNVLLVDNHAKLTDFGLAKVKQHVNSQTAQQTSPTLVGTLAWMAPELFTPEPDYSPASDVYALGVVLWEIAERAIPFEKAANPMLIPMWVQQGQRPTKPSQCQPAYAKLIGECWSARKEDRPTASMVQQRLQAFTNDPAHTTSASDTAVADPKLVSQGYRGDPPTQTMGYR